MSKRIKEGVWCGQNKIKVTHDLENHSSRFYQKFNSISQIAFSLDQIMEKWKINNPDKLPVICISIFPGDQQRKIIKSNTIEIRSTMGNQYIIDENSDYHSSEDESGDIKVQDNKEAIKKENEVNIDKKTQKINNKTTTKKRNKIKNNKVTKLIMEDEYQIQNPFSVLAFIHDEPLASVVDQVEISEEFDQEEEKMRHDNPLFSTNLGQVMANVVLSYKRECELSNPALISEKDEKIKKLKTKCRDLQEDVRRITNEKEELLQVKNKEIDRLNNSLTVSMKEKKLLFDWYIKSKISNRRVDEKKNDLEETLEQKNFWKVKKHKESARWLLLRKEVNESNLTPGVYSNLEGKIIIVGDGWIDKENALLKHFMTSVINADTTWEIFDFVNNSKSLILSLDLRNNIITDQQNMDKYYFVSRNINHKMSKFSIVNE